MNDQADLEASDWRRTSIGDHAGAIGPNGHSSHWLYRITEAIGVIDVG